MVILKHNSFKHGNEEFLEWYHCFMFVSRKIVKKYRTKFNLD